jgi:hypothetical protein
VPKSTEIDGYRASAAGRSDGPSFLDLCRFLASRRAFAKLLCKQEVTGSIADGSTAEIARRCWVF